jgi:hypothetical protein
MIRFWQNIQFVRNKSVSGIISARAAPMIIDKI